MALEIQGIDKLINKLNKLSNIQAKEVIEDVAKDVETAIVNEARKFSDTESLYIRKCDVRDYGTSYFVDIGLKNDGLVHISKMSHERIKHPLDVLSIGDIVEVKVIDVDLNKKRVALSLI